MPENTTYVGLDTTSTQKTALWAARAGALSAARLHLHQPNHSTIVPHYTHSMRCSTCNGSPEPFITCTMHAGYLVPLKLVLTTPTRPIVLLIPIPSLTF